MSKSKDCDIPLMRARAPVYSQLDTSGADDALMIGIFYLR